MTEINESGMIMPCSYLLFFPIRVDSDSKRLNDSLDMTFDKCMWRAYLLCMYCLTVTLLYAMKSLFACFDFHLFFIILVFAA